MKKNNSKEKVLKNLRPFFIFKSKFSAGNNVIKI